MQFARHLAVLSVVFVLGLMPIFDAARVGNPGSEDTAGFDGPLAWSRSGSLSDTPQGLVPIQNLSLQVRVPPGKSFYVYFDQQTQALKTKRNPDDTAGLPPQAIAAIDRSPAWIRSNLTKMLGRLSELVIDPTAVNDYTAPVFADMNGDGAVDIVLGDVTGGITLYRNIDPAMHYSEGFDSYVNAVFVKDATFFPPAVSVGGYAHVAVGDLNGDNLPDMAIGGVDGRIRVFMNNGPAGAPTWTEAGLIPSIDTLGYATPALADLNGDGALDLMVGSQAGWVYKSINLCANPEFVSDGDPATVTTPIWANQAVVDVGITSFSSPALAEMNGDGMPEMAVGDGAGRVGLFKQVGPNWVRDSTAFVGFSAGARASPALAHVDDDSLTDLVLGGQTGPLGYYANVGTTTAPKFMAWQNYTTNYDWMNFNQYYSDSNHVYLTYRSATPRLIAYSDIINNAPQEMVDEVAFSIANANAASLLNPLTFPEVYLNNTDSLYFNSQFTSYAQIMDYDLGTPGQWSTVRYLMNDSGSLVWYEYPRDVYYWWLVSLKGTDELATFINPTIVARASEGARSQSNGGLFWRWAAFNAASPSWPSDPAGRGYPKEEPPPVLRAKISNATVLWNNQTYSTGGIYDSTGWFIRDAGGNISRPWNMTNQAVEIVDHWVASTVPLNAQADNDGNRPIEPVRIQWEHNGNCGEISDMIWAALRSALIPARGICGYGGDHCWGEFYERGWHQIDDYWDASTSIIANNDNYHYGWNRDWSGLMTMRGDGLDVDVVPNYHKAWSASNDAGYLPDSQGLIDRANITVLVVDVNGNPVDGAKVTLGDYRYGASPTPMWESFGTQWTFTDAEGKAYLYTSEARQDRNTSNPFDGDTFDDGIALFVISKVGYAEAGSQYAERLKPSFGDAYNPRNAPMYYYNFSLDKGLPRPYLPVVPIALPPGGIYTMNVSFGVDSATQHPAVAARWNEGLAYHNLDFATGHRVTSFFASRDEFQKYVGWQTFRASNVSANVSSGSMSLGIPAGEDWYFVISNPGSIETTQAVNIQATLLVPQTVQQTVTISPSMIGQRLMSIPIRPANTDIAAVLSSIAGDFDYVRWFDSSSPSDPWKSYVPGRAYNSLTMLDETMGFWINFTQPCTWTITGYPAQSTAIALRAGWNLVGFPSSSVTYSVGVMKADLGLAGIRVESFAKDSPPYYLWRTPDSHALTLGEGYWVYVPQDCTWLVAA